MSRARAMSMLQTVWMESETLNSSCHLYIALRRLALPVSRVCTKECPMGYDSRTGPAQFAWEGAPNMQKTSPYIKTLGHDKKWLSWHLHSLSWQPRAT